MPSSQPSFPEYKAALDRLRRRAHLRRAVMTRGLTNSLEMPIFDEQEKADQELCQRWHQSVGFQAEHF